MSPLTDMLLRTAAIFAIAYFAAGFYMMYRGRKMSKEMTQQVTTATTELTEAIARELSSEAGRVLQSMPSDHLPKVH